MVKLFKWVWYWVFDPRGLVDKKAYVRGSQAGTQFMTKVGHKAVELQKKSEEGKQKAPPIVWIILFVFLVLILLVLIREFVLR